MGPSFLFPQDTEHLNFSVTQMKSVTIHNCVGPEDGIFESSFLMSGHQILGLIPARLPGRPLPICCFHLAFVWEIRKTGALELCVVTNFQVTDSLSKE